MSSLNRKQKGALSLVVSIFGSLVYIANNAFIIFDVTTLIVLFWLAYCAVLGTYLILSDKD